MRRSLAAVATALLLSSCSATGAPPTATGTTVPDRPATTGTGTTTPVAPATTPVAATTTPSPASSIELLFTGDMLPSDDLQGQAARDAGGDGYDFMPMLAEVAPIVAAADWSICHQETPVSDDDVGLAGYPRFNAPFELARAEAAVGYDACSTASNHSVDLGMAGITATLDTLDRVGIAHTGSARTAAEEARPDLYDVRGVLVAHLAYTFSLNGLPSPAPWAVNLIDPARIRADAAAATAAGAQIVVVSLHFGEEKVQTPSAYQEQVVDAVMQSPDVDLVVGHHAHVVQPIERRADGRWVIFGLGNFLAQQEVSASDPTPPHRDGVIVKVTFGRATDGSYKVSQVGYVPTFVDAPSDVVRLAPDFSRTRTERSLFARGAPLVDLTPR